MLVSEVLSRVRDQVSDSVADGSGNYRWSNELIIRYINDLRADIVRRHPEACCTSATAVSTNTVDDLTELTATGNTVGITRQWMSPLVDGICARLLGEDAEDVANRILGIDHKNQQFAELPEKG